MQGIEKPIEKAEKKDIAKGSIKNRMLVEKIPQNW